MEITGTFEKNVGDGPKFMLNATYGSIHSIDTVENLCDHVDIVQKQALNCPPEKGKAVMSTTFFINEMMMPPVGLLFSVPLIPSVSFAVFAVFLGSRTEF